MFHKKYSSAVLAAAFIFSFAFTKAYAASRNLSSLKLDFLRSEEQILNQPAEEEPQKLSMAGTIIYNKNPYVFIFMIKAPLVQTLFVNEETAFILEDNTLYDASENADFLNQTCLDFLNWFKEDFGLSDSFFKPGDRWVQDNQVLSQWDCTNYQDQPLNKILVWSDARGQFTRLQMFVNSDSLVTQTDLESYEAAAGRNYPSRISSISYNDEGQAFLKTQLTFSNASFVLSEEDLAIIEKTLAQSEFLYNEYQKKDLSEAGPLITPVIPEEASYRVSIPSVLVGTSFKFYKKFITSQDMSNCPFYPSCSQFMLQAVSENGIFGFFQGLERLKRCTATEHKRNQYETLSSGKHYDPVPVLGKKEK